MKKKEMKLYELLGVKLFQKLVFLLEKLVHIKDKGKNINYHMPSTDISAMDAFIKYLFYNGAIHTRNLAMFLVYLLFKALLSCQLRPYDYILCLLAVKDLYCIMLQRYNFLRIERCRELMCTRQERRIQNAIIRQRASFHSSYNPSYAQEDLIVIKRIIASIKNRESIVLSDADIAALNRLLPITDSSNNEIENNRR